MSQIDRVAVLADIHGNLPALEAVLTDVAALSPDEIVIAGDVMVGPLASECLRLLRSLPNVSWIRGNTDRLTVDAAFGRPITVLPADVVRNVEWGASNLLHDERAFLAALPAVATLNVRGLGDVLVCHATPRSDDEIFTAITPEDRVRPMIEGVAEHTIICGHTHVQFDRTIGNTRLVNAGSVGMPFERPAGAYWLALGPGVQFKRTDYDAMAARSRIIASGYPDAENFASRYVVDPPDAQQMQAALERAR